MKKPRILGTSSSSNEKSWLGPIFRTDFCVRVTKSYSKFFNWAIQKILSRSNSELLYISLRILWSFAVWLCEASSSAPELTYATISAEFTLLMFDGNNFEAWATCQSPSDCNSWASLFRNLAIVLLVKIPIEAFNIKSIANFSWILMFSFRQEGCLLGQNLDYKIYLQL